MSKREDLIKHLQTNEERYTGLRLLDKVDKVLKDHREVFTDFLDPYQVSLCLPILKKIGDINFYTCGIAQEAERKIILLLPEYMEMEENNIPITGVKLLGDFTKNDISHRDVLGSILGLGIKREKIGDIYTGDGYAYIIAFKEICKYISLYLDKISKYKVSSEEVTTEEINKLEDNYKLINATVPSLRLDVILSAGFNGSRSSIAKKINNDRVKVNWKPVNQSSYTLNKGDMISYKGLGRVQLLDIIGKTKKDRLKVTIKRYI